jgi:hypothetical protein
VVKKPVEKMNNKLSELDSNNSNEHLSPAIDPQQSQVSILNTLDEDSLKVLGNMLVGKDPLSKESLNILKSIVFSSSAK